MNIQYENKIVAFIDVLGFSDIVYSESMLPLSEYFDFIVGEFKTVAKKNSFTYLIISDSIVISAPLDQKSLRSLVKVLCIFQHKLLGKGILVRGAISFGNLYINKTRNILVGPGMINAYRLESKAIYPRIIIDRKLIKYFYEGTYNAASDLEYLISEPPMPYLKDYPYLKYTEIHSVYCVRIPRDFEKLKIFLSANYYNNQLIEKYEWLVKHLLFSFDISHKKLANKLAPSVKDKKRLKVFQRFIHDLHQL